MNKLCREKSFTYNENKNNTSEIISSPLWWRRGRMARKSIEFLGSFFNYVDKILPNFDPLPPRVDKCGHFTSPSQKWDHTIALYNCNIVDFDLKYLLFSKYFRNFIQYKSSGEVRNSQIFCGRTYCPLFHIIDFELKFYYRLMRKKPDSTMNLAILRPFQSFFHKLHKYLLQNLGSDGHFEVLNKFTS